MSANAQPSLEDIRRDFERVPADVVTKASQFAASILADVAGRRGAMDGRIAAVSPEMKLCGPAFTIEVRPGDNLMIHAAMSMAQPGDILVIDGKADQTCALMGAIMVNGCMKTRLGGIVMDAAMRDYEELKDMGFPVFSFGTNPNGPTKYVPGRINHPVSCGNMTVYPGDLIVGDADGVVVIERAKAASLLPLAAAKVADERKRIADIQAGKNLRPGWLDGALRAAGVLKEGETL